MTEANEPPMRVAILPVTPLQQNCSLIWCTKTMKAALVDPGGDLDMLKGALDKAGVTIKAVTPIGRYAIRIAFDDGHDTGLYTWESLHRIGRDRLKLETKHRALMNPA